VRDDGKGPPAGDLVHETHAGSTVRGIGAHHTEIAGKWKGA